MGVAIEGCLKYIPSIAFSSCDYNPDADLSALRDYVRKILLYVLDKGLPKGVCLNVNFPMNAPFKGVKVCRMGYGRWINEVVACRHPRGKDYYWMVGEYKDDEPGATDNDRWALNHGYVCITPTTVDVTAYEVMEEMQVLETP
jgi:5'-nucleotidase